MTQKPLCIYHGNCFDGFGAAWAVRHALGETGVEFHPGVYGETPPDVTGRDVIMVDFSYKRGVLEEMSRIARSMLILDHHKTAQEDLKNFWPPASTWKGHLAYTTNPHHDFSHSPIAAQFDMERSGAGMAWDFFHPGIPRPILIDYIEDRDLWRFKLPMSRLVHAGLSAFDFDFDYWDKLILELYPNAEGISDLASDGGAIEAKHQRDIENLLPIVGRRMIIGGYDVPVANLPMTMTSDAGHKMAQVEPFAACYWDTDDGRVFSLRAADDGLDVSAIALSYGGGGHAKAAGFTMPLGWEGDQNED